MPELMVDLITSLDGYASAEGWPGWWGLEGPEYLGWLEEDQPERRLPDADGRDDLPGDVADVDGRRTGAGEFRPEEADSLTGLDAMPKVVFSSTLTEPLAWPNTRLVTTDAVEAVRAMKAEGSLPLRTLGSVRLCRSLLAAGLVDRFRLVVFPVDHRGDRCRTGLRRLPRRRASSWSRAAPSTGARSCSTTCRACWTARPAAAEPEGVGRTQRCTGNTRWVTRSPRMTVVGSPSMTSVMPIAPK